MNVQRGKNYIFMNVQLAENHIFMNESGVQGALHGVSTDELSHFNGEKCTHTKPDAVHFLGILHKWLSPFLTKPEKMHTKNCIM